MSGVVFAGAMHPAVAIPFPKARLVEIDDRRYYLSHLKAPRGRGSWLFETHAGVVVFHHNDTFAKARAAAKQWAAANGHAGLFVCP